jgi:endonuclease G, mitochondrial
VRISSGMHFKGIQSAGMVALLASMVWVLSGCAGGQTYVRKDVPYSAAHIARESGLTAQEQAWVDDNCVFGEPKLQTEWSHGPCELIARKGYVLLHSDQDKVPLWVCEKVELSEFSGKATRSNKFFAEPKIPKGKRAELGDYLGSGYDRGHMAPAGNQKAKQELQDQTFSLANMCPQAGALNQKIWRNLEDTTRDWVKKLGPAYIITGPLFYDPKEESPATANGAVEYTTIGKDKVAVPTHFYKIVVWKQGGDYRCVAFVMGNRAYANQFDFASNIKTIDWIEERSGIDFMPDLDPLAEAKLESKPGKMPQ